MIYDVSIIGFGATGVAFMKSLQSFCYEQNIDALNVAIISEKNTLALGKAFGCSDDIHIVNTTPELMSIQEEDHLGFKRWLDKNEIKSVYPNRKIFAKYLKETFENLQKDRVINFKIFEDEVTDIEIHGKNFIKIISATHHHIYAKRVVFCLGSLSSKNYEFLDSKVILPNQIFNLKKNIDSVAIAGTSLTSVDCIRTLKKIGVQKIYLFSRSNKLPTPVTAMNKYVPQYFQWDNIERNLIRHSIKNRLKILIKIFTKEISLLRDNELKISNKLISNPCEYFSYILDKAKNGDMPIQDILVSTRNFAHKIWSYLTEEDKRNFILNYSSDWAVWRHPIPIFIIEELQKYFKEGFIELIKPEKIIANQHGILIESNQFSRQIKVNYFVDGTGGTNNIKKLKNKLIENLLIKKIVISHPCGGIRTNSLNYKVLNKFNSEIYNIGPLAKGDLFSTNAFWFNRKCADKLASQIINDIKKEK